MLHRSQGVLVLVLITNPLEIHSQETDILSTRTSSPSMEAEGPLPCSEDQLNVFDIFAAYFSMSHIITFPTRPDCLNKDLQNVFNKGGQLLNSISFSRARRGTETRNIKFNQNSLTYSSLRAYTMTVDFGGSRPLLQPIECLPIEQNNFMEHCPS